MRDARPYYNQVREILHAMRNRISVLTNSVRFVRDDLAEAADLPEQYVEMKRIERNMANLVRLIEELAAVALPGLALSSINGDFFEVTCLEQDTVEHQSLTLFFAHLFHTYPTLATGTLIVVAPEARLLALRQFFMQGPWRVRYATAPMDILFMMQHPRGSVALPIDAIVMAPAADEAGEWWRDVRYMMKSAPLLIHLRSSEPLSLSETERMLP